MTTRYPKKGKGSKWTALELKAVTAAWKGDKLSEESLHGEVRVASTGAVAVRWLSPYKWEGKLTWFYCGTSPHDSLEDIRDKKDWCRSQVKAGVHPGDRKKLDKLEAQQAVEAALAAEDARKVADKPFKEMFEDWLSRGVNRKDGNAELQRIFEKDVLPRLGAFPVRLVGERELTDTIRAVINRDSPRMASVLYNSLVQMYTWARKREPWRTLLHEGQKGDPMEIVELSPLLPRDYDPDNVCDRVLSDNEIRTLREVLENQQKEWENANDRRRAPRPLNKQSQIALWICLSTLCRIGELTMAEWKHVDIYKGEWFIPKENVKDNVADHTVFLSPFALGQFQALHSLTGKSRWCFPSINDPEIHRDVKTVTKQVGDRQVRFMDRKEMKGRRNDNTLVIGEELWTPHDLRRTGATLMQQLGIELTIIDRCQNHVLEGSKVRRHYLHHDYAQEKKHAWETLGTRLDAVFGVTPKLQLAA